MDFPGGSDGKESACNAGDLGLILGLGRSPGKRNATHSSVLAWKIPWTEEPGRLRFMRSQRIRHDYSDWHLHWAKLLYVNSGNDFLDLTPQAMTTTTVEMNMQDYIKLKLLHSKGNHQQNENTIYWMGENICKVFIWYGSKLGKEYIKAVCCHPAYLTCMQSTSCEMLGWMSYKLESRLPGEIPATLDMQMITP